MEVDPPRAEAALSGIGSRLQREVERERMTRERGDEILSQLQAHADLDQVAGCGLVIEAIVEKSRRRRRCSRASAPSASPRPSSRRTPSVSVSALAAASGRPEQVLGLHFFNPPTVLPLVEIISTDGASEATIAQAAAAFSESVDRVIVHAKSKAPASS